MGLRRPKLNMGKKVASGVVNSSNTSMFFDYASGSSQLQSFYISISGLNFKPSTIEVSCVNSSNFTTYNELGDYHYNQNKTVKMFYYPSTQQSLSVSNIRGNTNGAYVNSTGFRIPVLLQNNEYQWKAYE
jgi:hypothetical protein